MANLQPSNRFWLATLLAAAPQLLVLYAFSEGSLAFTAAVFAWNIAPFVVAAVLFASGTRAVAWGWLITTALWGLWSAASVVLSRSSTASLGFLWAPVWSILLVGPIGAGGAILHARRRQGGA